MARSPFSGTFQPNVRPTVVTAPDALVYINGEMEVIGCPQCSRFFDFNKYVTSVQVDLSVESVPGSASISLSIPRHTIDDFYFDGNPVITPMMEVEIYAKGYYLLEGLPQYYPIFWGVVTEVGDNYSSGEHSVSIHCADILKWWELCKMNINPAFTAPAGQQGRSIFGNVFFGMNPYDIIWSLALQSYGDVLVGTGSLVSTYKEASQRQTFDAALSDLMLYWEQRFSRIRSNLLLYGVNGVAVRGDSLDALYSRTGNTGTVKKPSHFASASVRNANGGKDGGQMVFDPSDPNVTAFRTQFQQAGQVNFWQSEYQSKLELANAAKEAAGFEFFMDVDGSIVFKPPFYNLDILANKPVSWIQDIDIIEWDLSESEAEVVTQIVMQGSFGGNVEFGFGEETTPFTSVTDYHLLRKYGWRSQNYNSEFMGDTQLMFYHGLDILDRLNSKRHRGTVTIPFRPELRLGFPVYLAPKDQIWYVSGISHNIAFGGRASTTLTLTAKRSKFIAPKGIGTLNLTGFKGTTPTPNQISKNVNLSFPYTSRQLSKGAQFELKLNGAASLPPTPEQLTNAAGADNPYDPLILRHPKTGRIVGYPNVCMVYTRPFAPADADLNSTAGQTSQPEKRVNKANQGDFQKTAVQQATDIQARYKYGEEDRLRDKHMSNRYQYGLNSAGVYVYAHDKSMDDAGVIGEILLLPSANVTVTPVTDKSNPLLKGKKSSMIRPVSDERGFEVIGHFRYGRRVGLRDGRLVLTGNTNDRTNIDLQLALGGGLFETLTAQSQGLTTISTAYPNPAATLANLEPDELQTAAVIDPDTKTPQFTDVGDNFVAAAPLGSPAQKGVPASVEASQLSRALTIAEMTIKDTSQGNSGKQAEDDCPCLTGRSDLAFINVGYQVKTINPASAPSGGLYNQGPGGTFGSAQGFVSGSSDVGGIGTVKDITGPGFDPSIASSPINAGNEQNLQHNVDFLNAKSDALQKQLDEARAALDKVDQKKNKAGYMAASQKVTDLENQLEAVNNHLIDANLALNEAQSGRKGTDGTVMPASSEIIGKVESYLTTLYSALDDPHQEYESAIRGDNLPGGNNSPDGQDTSFGPPGPPDFAPPFSPANRATLGDNNANATIAAAHTAAQGITQAWGKFGNDLKNNAKRTALQNEINNDKAAVQRLEAQKTQLQQQLAGNVLSIGDPKGQIDSINKQIAQLQQQIANDQAQLNTLPAK